MSIAYYDPSLVEKAETSQLQFTPERDKTTVQRTYHGQRGHVDSHMANYKQRVMVCRNLHHAPPPTTNLHTNSDILRQQYALWVTIKDPHNYMITALGEVAPSKK